MSPVGADKARVTGLRQQIPAQALQTVQATGGRRVTFIGDVVRGTGKVVDGHDRRTQMRRTQQ